MTIAEKIKESRLKLGLTQQEVSEKLFVTRQTISNWENNRSTPDIDTLIKLSDLYQIDLETLLKPETNLPPSSILAHFDCSPRLRFHRLLNTYRNNDPMDSCCTFFVTS